jgi:hypothetical protein
MKINRRRIVAGLTVAVLAGGAGGAIAATTSGAKAAGNSWTAMPRGTGAWHRYGSGWHGGGARAFAPMANGDW